MKRYIFTTIVLNMFFVKGLFAQPFSCDTSSYLFGSDQSASYTKAYELNLNDATVSSGTRFGTSHINAIGYNVDDDYIYGFEYGSGKVVRVDADFTITRFTVASLPNENYYLGDVSLDGIYFLANRQSSSSGSSGGRGGRGGRGGMGGMGGGWDSSSNNDSLTKIQRVDLKTMTLMPELNLIYPPGVSKIVSADFAFNPKDNKLYTVNSKNNKLCKIDPTTGVVEELGSVGISSTYSVINFFDGDGNFYFHANDKIYKIDHSVLNSSSPTANLYKNMPGLISSGDGARCPNAPIVTPPPTPKPPIGTPFTCNSNSYLFGSDQSDPYSDAFNLSLIDGGITLAKRITGSHINALGYNVKDDFIYGFEYGDINSPYSRDKYHVVRLDANFNKESFKITGLPEQTYYLGDVSPDGTYYLANRQSGYTTTRRGGMRGRRGGRDSSTNSDGLKEIQRVDLSTMTLKPKLTLIYPFGVSKIVSADFAFNPKDGKLYTVNSINNSLYRIDPDNGNVENLGSVGINDTYSVISFFDKNGYFYFYKNGDKKIYKIDISDPSSVNPSAIEFSTVPSGMITSGDGARCPNAEVTVNTATPSLDYRFDECLWEGGANEVKDLNNSSNDGTAKGGAVTFYSGVVNRSGDFSANAYVQAGDDLDDIFGTTSDQFTITAWIKPKKLTDAKTNHNTKNTFIAKASDLHNDNIEIGVNPDGTLHLYLDTQHKNKSADIGSGITEGSWHFVAVSYDGSNVDVTIDTNHFTENSTWSGGGKIRQAVGSAFTIGASLHVDNFFNGNIDEVKVFDTSLSQTQIDTIYQNELNGKNYDGGTRNATDCLQPIGCSESAWILNDTKDLYEQDMITRGAVKHSNALVAYTNAIGYNYVDGFIWGYDNEDDTTQSLIKIGYDENGDFTSEVKGPILGIAGEPDLPYHSNGSTDKAYINVGDVDNYGFLHLLHTDTNTLYVVDLNGSSSNYLKVVDHKSLTYNGNGLDIVDWAFHPMNNKLYALGEADANGESTLYEIDTVSNTITTKNITGLAKSAGSIYEAFFDDNGYFYAYSPDVGKVYRIDITDPSNIDTTALFFSDVNTGNGGDTARCNKAPVNIDYADAGGAYRSLLADNGARHKIPPVGVQNVYLGNGVSAESDAKVSDNDDDDALAEAFAPLYNISKTYSVKLKVNNTTLTNATLVGWIDFDRNGEFDTDEGVSKTISSTGIVTLEWNVPSDIKPGMTYARFRITTDAITVDEADSYGVKGDGEVEDYKIEIREKSVYDAWDNGSPTHDISTKIVKKGFRLALAKISGSNDDNDTKARVVESSKCDEAFDMDMSGFVDFNISNSSSFPKIVESQPFNLSDAYKSARIQFYWIDRYGDVQTSCSSDTFSIRPDRYEITLPESLVAGKDFNITIKAKGYDGITIQNYEENASVFAFDYNETKSDQGCLPGHLDITKTKFVQGVALVAAKYDDVGILKFEVHELALDQNGKREYAFEDRDDTPDKSARLISSAIVNSSEFKAAKMFFDWKLVNGDSSNGYTYFNDYNSSDPDSDKMAAKFDLNVTMKSFDDNLLNNFTGGCYAKNVDISFLTYLSGDSSYEIVSEYLDNNNTKITTDYKLPAVLNNGVNDYDAYKIESSLFSRGKAAKKARFNFKRYANKAQNPVKFSIAGVSAEVDGFLKSDTTEKSLKFLYVRAHVSDQSAVGKDMSVKVYYEAYCKGCDKALFGLEDAVESLDSINWYILKNINEDYCDFGVGAGSAPGSGGNDTVSAGYGNVNVNRASFESMKIVTLKTPTIAKVTYKPKKYLIFNQFNENARTHSFTTVFNAQPQKWAGKGELGLSVDMSVNSRRSLDKIDW